MLLFSMEVVVFIVLVFFTGSLMLVNSYMKAVKGSQQLEIVQKIEKKRELVLKKNEINGVYRKMSSISELMKKAEHLQMKAVTLDKTIKVSKKD